MIGAYQIHIPVANDTHVVKLLDMLNVPSLPVHLSLYPVQNAEPCACFDNVARQVVECGGSTVYGWQFWKHPYMIEAEFHAVWRSPEGYLHDITPKDDPEIKTTLFVIDEKRAYTGAQIDNVRINTTGSGVIDDLIEVEKAKYRFLNKDGRDKIIGYIPLSDPDQDVWTSLHVFSEMFERLHTNGCDENSLCFCGSWKSYAMCHREEVLKGIKEI